MAYCHNCANVQQNNDGLRNELNRQIRANELLREQLANQQMHDLPFDKLGPFGIIKNIVVDAEFGDNYYVVKGPQRIIGQFARFGIDVLFGSTSPFREITLDASSKVKAGIKGTHFAFIYPMAGICQLSAEQKRMLDITDNIIGLLTFGGYVYIHYEAGNIVIDQVNGIAEGNDLHFGGPHNLPLSSIQLLQAQGRLQDITVGELLATGFNKFAWIGPREFADGFSFPTAHENGAFIYVHGSDNSMNRYFEVIPCPEHLTTTMVPVKPYSTVCVAGRSSSTSEDESLSCVICLETRREVFFNPCGHFVSCKTCAGQVITCPICRKRIMQKYTVYM